jgi:hypothetical protein
MANQFYVSPLGGANPLHGLGMIAQGLDRRKEEEERQAQKVRMQELGAEAMRLYGEGTPDEIAKFSIQNPEMGQLLSQQIGFKNEATQENMRKGMESILAGGNPEQILTERIQMVESQGGDASQTRNELAQYQANPEGYLEKVERSYAFAFPQQYNAYAKTKTGGSKPTANIQDFQYYEELKKTSPEAAEQFARQVGITEKPTGTVKETTAMQNFNTWSAMPEGAEKDAFAQLVGIKPKANPKEERVKAEEIDLLQSKVQSAQDTVGTIDEILNDESLSDMVGLPSAFPTLPGSYVANLEAKVEQFRNQLTLENLDKMSGVLTDRDIQVLASAASGLETTMSPDAFKRQLNKIKSTLNRGIKQNQTKLKAKGADQKTTTVESETTEEMGDQGDSISEGTIIRNPSTGEQLILQGGQWVGYNG